jgi:hypothetical protein
MAKKAQVDPAPSPELGEPILAEVPAEPVAEVPAEPAAVAPAMPKPGDSVTYHDLDGDHAGTVIFARGDAAAPQCDLVVYRAGVPQALASVPHGPGRPRCWSRACEVPRNPTVADLLAEAVVRGERVPKVGLQVVYRLAMNSTTHDREVAVRARIEAIYSPTEVKLGLYAFGPPPTDPAVADDPVEFRQHVGYGTTGNDVWCYEGEYVDSPPRPTGPSTACTHCGTAAAPLIEVRTGHVFPHLLPPMPIARLCPPCLAALTEWLATPPVAADA